MKFLKSCTVLTLGLMLWLVPMMGQTKAQLVSEKVGATEKVEKVETLQELFTLVENMKAEGTLAANRQWVETEYNRLIQEMDSLYHEAPITTPNGLDKKADKSAQKSAPNSYSWVSNH